jgi:tRNA(Arg) A34 adenosine deaminase TadA
MRRAIDLARQGVRDRIGGPFGAVVVREGRVIGEACNCVTSSNDPTAHAEVEAIRTACRLIGTFDLSGCTIYSSCEPCPMCLAAICWARIGAIYHAGTRHDAAAAGFDDEAIYAEVTRPVGNRSIPMMQLMRDEALAAFREWQSDAGRVPY